MGKYKDIKAGTTLNVSGMDDTVITGVIGQGARINKSGMGDLKIKGTVCENVSITVSGMGDLIFSNRPPQSVIDRINKSGMGSVKIPGGNSKSSNKSSDNKKRKYSSSDSDNDNDNDSNDSYSGGSSYNNIISGIVSKHGVISGGTVIGNMSIGGSSIGSVVSSDGLIKVTKDGITTTYAGNSVSPGRNGKTIIDGEEVTDNDPRILHVEAASRNNSSIVINDGNSINIYGNRIGNFEEEDSESSSEESRSEDDRIDHKAKRQKTEDNPLDKYSEDTQLYIDSRKKKPKNTDLLKDLQLTEEDEKLLENYLDPILATVINIPVKLFSRRYELDTILSLKEPKDPFSKLDFTKRDIVADRKGAEKLEKLVQQIKKTHEEKNNAQPDAIKNTR